MVFKRFTWVIFTTSALTPYSVVYITLYAIYSVCILKQLVIKILAEKKGFEPSVRLPAHTLSKRAPSTTRPPLHGTTIPF